MADKNLISETRWFHLRKIGDTIQYESKFLTGKAIASFSEIDSEWKVWSSDERLEFARAFSVKQTLTQEDEKIAELIFQDSDGRVLSVAASLAVRHSDKLFGCAFLIQQLSRPSDEPKANFIQHLGALGDAQAIAALEQFWHSCAAKLGKAGSSPDEWLVFDFLDCSEILARLKNDAKYLEGVQQFLASPHEAVRALAKEILSKRS